MASRLDKKQKFIVYAPPYDERIGGSIVLHKLCDLLNECGQEAYLWPFGKEYEAPLSIVEYFRRALTEMLKFIRFGGYYTRCNSFNTPYAKKKDLIDAIVIYPEIVDGNPLQADKVVRWFLHKPGFHTSKVNYGDNELYFYFQKVFNDFKINKALDNQLMIIDFKADIYRQINFGERSGRCFVLRKGKHRKKIHNIKKDEVVDELSHKEMAAIFNKVEYCYSYDMYTMYSFYASLCGCKSIVIPSEGVSVEQWQPVKELRWGVAYGEQDVERALKTKGQRVEYMKNKEHENVESVNKFISKSQNFWKL